MTEEGDFRWIDTQHITDPNSKLFSDHFIVIHRKGRTFADRAILVSPLDDIELSRAVVVRGRRLSEAVMVLY